MPSDQQRLYDGGRDSLLAKYVAKFADRPPAFWSDLLSPEIAQARLIGDVDQTILDLAVSPETTWQSLDGKGLVPEFLAMVRERYAFEGPHDNPASWVESLVATLAVTESFMGYGERADFPLADRLPPPAVRAHHRQLLYRWLRDSESRTAWDRWIQDVETRVDLAVWAKDKAGFCFGFPHLVRMRWQQIADAFATAAAKSSTTAMFFEKNGALIAREAEHSKASLNPAGSWELMRQLQEYLAACEHAKQLAEEADTIEGLVQVFVEQATVVDAAHINVRHNAELQSQPAVVKVADRAYAAYTNTLNGRFFERYVAGATASVPTLPYVTDHLEEGLWTTQGKRAVLIVDALRYDCAHLIGQMLKDFTVELQPMRAALPTVTPVGMTALMPVSAAEVSFEIKGNSLHPRVNGKDAAARSTRIAFLKDFGADCREIGEIEANSDAPDELGELLVVFGHDEVDHIGHGSANALVRHLQVEIERIVRLVRKLHRWGYPEVHVVTDHGFILLDEAELPDEVACNTEWCRVKKERFALVARRGRPACGQPAVRLGLVASRRTATRPSVLQGRKVLLPRWCRAARARHSAPRLTQPEVPSCEAARYVEVVLPTFELMRTAVKVSLRPRHAPFRRSSQQMTLFAATGSDDEP